MTVRLAAVARGSQPAVVKLASYGSGARLGSMTNYVSREGRIAVEDEQGNRIESREELAQLRDEWSHLFQNRAETRDLAAFTVHLERSASSDDEDLHELVRDVLAKGFGGRSYAYAVSAWEGGGIAVEGVLVLRDGGGERLTGDEKAAGIVQARYDASAAGAHAARFSFQGYGNGVGYGSAKLRNLVDRHGGDVRDRDGRMIGDYKQAGDLVQKDWRHELHSRKSRDVMHIVMSARAGTDEDAFNEAVRDFLAAQFPGHRYVFALHDPDSDPKEEGEGGRRPHVHAHAIVTMRSEDGERVRTTPEVFRQWRTLMAEKARDHGIEMEMTDRREFAAAPAYGRTQVRPVSREGRTEHVGTSEAAHVRYEAKRTGRRVMALSERSIRYAKTVTESWRKIAMVSGDRHVVAFADTHRNAVITALSEQATGDTGSVIHADFGLRKDANTVSWREGFSSIVETMDVNKVMTRDEFYAYEKNVRETIEGISRTVPDEERREFDKIVDRVSEFVEARRKEAQHYHGDMPRGPGWEPTEVRQARRLGIEPDYEMADSIVERSGGEIGRDEAAIGRGAMGRIADADEFLALARQDWRDTGPFELERDAAYAAAGRLAASGNRVLREEAGMSNELRSSMLSFEAQDVIKDLQSARRHIEQGRLDDFDTTEAEGDRDIAMNKAVRMAREGNFHVRDYALNDRDLADAIAQSERDGDEAMPRLQDAMQRAEARKAIGALETAHEVMDEAKQQMIDTDHADERLETALRSAADLATEGNRYIREHAAANDPMLVEKIREGDAEDAMVALEGIRHYRHNIRLIEDAGYADRFYEPGEPDYDPREDIDVDHARAYLDEHLKEAAELGLKGNSVVLEAAEKDRALRETIERLRAGQGAENSAPEAASAAGRSAVGDAPVQRAVDSEAVARYGEKAVREGDEILVDYDAASDAYGKVAARYSNGYFRTDIFKEDREKIHAEYVAASKAYDAVLDRYAKEALDGNTYLYEQSKWDENFHKAIREEIQNREAGRADLFSRPSEVAVALHGEDAVRTGNELFSQIKASRQVISDLRETLAREDGRASNEEELAGHDARAAKLIEAENKHQVLLEHAAGEALDGNSYVLEMRRIMPDLNNEIHLESQRRADRAEEIPEYRPNPRDVARHGADAVRSGDALLVQMNEAITTSAELAYPETQYDRETRTYRFNDDEAAYDARMAKLTEANNRYSELVERGAREALDGNTYLREVGETHITLRFAIGMESHRREQAGQDRDESGQSASRPADRTEQASRPPEETRTDPPQQHVPRQEQLRRQEQERDAGGDEQER